MLHRRACAACCTAAHALAVRQDSCKHRGALSRSAALQVGAELFVGLCDGHRGVSWPILIRTFIGWVVTLIFAGLISALIMAIGVFSPNLRATEALDVIKTQVNDTQSTVREAVMGKCSMSELGDSAMEVEAFSWGVAEQFRFPLRIADAVEYVGELAVNNMESCSDAPIVPPDAVDLFPTVEEQIQEDIDAEEEDD